MLAFPLTIPALNPALLSCLCLQYHVDSPVQDPPGPIRV